MRSEYHGHCQAVGKFISTRPIKFGKFVYLRDGYAEGSGEGKLPGRQGIRTVASTTPMLWNRFARVANSSDCDGLEGRMGTSGLGGNLGKTLRIY